MGNATAAAGSALYAALALKPLVLRMRTSIWLCNEPRASEIGPKILGWRTVFQHGAVVTDA